MLIYHLKKEKSYFMPKRLAWVVEKGPSVDDLAQQMAEKTSEKVTKEDEASWKELKNPENVKNEFKKNVDSAKKELKDGLKDSKDNKLEGKLNRAETKVNEKFAEALNKYTAYMQISREHYSNVIHNLLKLTPVAPSAKPAKAPAPKAAKSEQAKTTPEQSKAPSNNHSLEINDDLDLQKLELKNQLAKEVPPVQINFIVKQAMENNYPFKEQAMKLQDQAHDYWEEINRSPDTKNLQELKEKGLNGATVDTMKTEMKDVLAAYNKEAGHETIPEAGSQDATKLTRPTENSSSENKSDTQSQTTKIDNPIAVQENKTQEDLKAFDKVGASPTLDITINYNGSPVTFNLNRTKNGLIITSQDKSLTMGPTIKMQGRTQEPLTVDLVRQFISNDNGYLMQRYVFEQVNYKSKISAIVDRYELGPVDEYDSYTDNNGATVIHMELDWGTFSKDPDFYFTIQKNGQIAWRYTLDDYRDKEDGEPKIAASLNEFMQSIKRLKNEREMKPEQRNNDAANKQMLINCKGEYDQEKLGKIVSIESSDNSEAYGGKSTIIKLDWTPNKGLATVNVAVAKNGNINYRITTADTPSQMISGTTTNLESFYTAISQAKNIESYKDPENNNTLQSYRQLVTQKMSNDTAYTALINSVPSTDQPDVRAAKILKNVRDHFSQIVHSLDSKHDAQYAFSALPDGYSLIAVTPSIDGQENGPKVAVYMDKTGAVLTRIVNPNETTLTFSSKAPEAPLNDPKKIKEAISTLKEGDIITFEQPYGKEKLGFTVKKEKDSFIVQSVDGNVTFGPQVNNKPLTEAVLKTSLDKGYLNTLYSFNKLSGQNKINSFLAQNGLGGCNESSIDDRNNNDRSPVYKLNGWADNPNADPGLELIISNNGEIFYKVMPCYNNLYVEDNNDLYKNKSAQTVTELATQLKEIKEGIRNRYINAQDPKQGQGYNPAAH